MNGLSSLLPFDFPYLFTEKKNFKTGPNVHPRPSEFTAIRRNISYAVDRVLVKCYTKGNYFLI